MNIYILTAICAIATYFICGIPFGYLIALIFGHVDVRTTGSKNIGTTNVGRSVGKGAAAATLALDCLKGLMCVCVSRVLIVHVIFAGDYSYLAHTSIYITSLCVIVLFCILGHVFSPYLGFHGGKGIAVGLGATLGLYWPVSLTILGLFIILAVPTRYVSLGSLAAAFAFPLGCFLTDFPPLSLVPATAVALIVIWAHRENIKKLISGTESKFSFHKAKGSQKKGSRP